MKVSDFVSLNFFIGRFAGADVIYQFSVTKMSKKQDNNKEVANIGHVGKKKMLDLSPQQRGGQELVAWPSPSPENFFFSRQLPTLPSRFLGPCDDGDLLIALKRDFFLEYVKFSIIIIHHCHDQLWDFVIVIFPPSSSRAKNTMVGTNHGGNVPPSNDENDDDDEVDDDDNGEDDGDEFDYDGYDDDDDHLFWPPR